MTYLEQAAAQLKERMTITTISDAMDNSSLPKWEALLSAYKTDDEAKAGYWVFTMINDYLDEEAQDLAIELEAKAKEDAEQDHAEAIAENRKYGGAA